MTDLSSLIARLEKAEGPDRGIDAEVAEACGIVPEGYERAVVHEKAQTYFWHRENQKAPYWSIPVTSSIDAAVSLAERVLPGWAWKVGTCCVSDDAWLAPDFNSPIHGERLKKELPNVEYGSIWDVGVDIDQRPPGRPAIALCIAILRALDQKGSSNG